MLAKGPMPENADIPPVPPFRRREVIRGTPPRPWFRWSRPPAPAPQGPPTAEPEAPPPDPTPPLTYDGGGHLHGGSAEGPGIDLKD